MGIRDSDYKAGMVTDTSARAKKEKQLLKQMKAAKKEAMKESLAMRAKGATPKWLNRLNIWVHNSSELSSRASDPTPLPLTPTERRRLR